jgi:SAM-dependent methyltransferase
VTDWRSYDCIADRYDAVAADRFAAVARRIWALVAPRGGERILDLGTGTGIVPAALREAEGRPALSAGCDRSFHMLCRARARMPELLVAVADAATLPFRDRTFDVVTASFVLSHLREPQRALEEAFRVLESSGAAAVSSWATVDDPVSEAWGRCLAEAVGSEETKRASVEVLPSEDLLSRPRALEAALDRAGFEIVASDAAEVPITLTLDRFLDDRELTAGGRRAAHLLGGDAWRSFRARAKAALHARFGPSVAYSRRAFVVVGRKS